MVEIRSLRSKSTVYLVLKRFAGCPKPHAVELKRKGTGVSLGGFHFSVGFEMMESDVLPIRSPTGKRG